MNVTRVFPMIGVVFGAVFVFVNAGGLPGFWPTATRIVGGVAVLAAVWFGMIRSRRPEVAAHPRAVRPYWIAVGAELIAIPVGASILNNVLEHGELTVVWVVLVVGAHFLPAKAFGFAEFTVLGGTLIGLALVGGAAALLVDPVAAPVTGVLAGITLLGFTVLMGRRMPVAG